MEGANIVVCARDPLLLAAAQAELGLRARAGQQVLALSADVSKPDDVRNLVEFALKNLSANRWFDKQCRCIRAKRSY